jgi:EAL domain-containing protein (putative c-di-GMP-specific phosphodiesterase class I)
MTESGTALYPAEKPRLDLVDLGTRLAKATVGLRTKAVSLHAADGQVLWSSLPFLGIEQREAIRDALEGFAGVGARMRIDRALGDQMTAVMLRAADRANVTRGFAMLILDSRVIFSKGRAADLPVPALQIIHEFGRLVAIHAPPPVTLGGESGGGADEGDDEPQADGSGKDLDDERAALRDLKLSLHVQPLLALRAHARVRRFEVLLRSRTEAGDSTGAPLEILQRATERGLGTVIDRRVVSLLIDWLQKRPDIAENGPCLFSVNLSSTALRDEHFLRFVQSSLEKAGLPRGILAFEIKASALSRRKNRAVRVAQALEAIGCGLVIDDFSIADNQLDLLRLPGVRMVKLAPSLTAAATTDVFAQAMIAASAQIARVCGFFTVAKHIETEAVRDHCRSLGVDFLQGYVVSGPTPIDSIVPLAIIEEEPRDEAVTVPSE